MNSLLNVHKLSKSYKKDASFYALQDINFDLNHHEQIGIVGESGSGKSTLAKLLIGLLKPTSGKIFIENRSLSEISIKEKSRFIQMISQDWMSSFNPRMTIFEILAEPLKIHRRTSTKDLHKKIESLLVEFELDLALLKRTPRQLSGGQLQRVAIARALSLEPRILIADEVTSSLDLFLRKQILKLLKEKSQKLGFSLIFISHDMEAVKFIASRILVMFQGKIVEEGSDKALEAFAVHPYTHRLMNSGKYIPNHENLWETLRRDFTWTETCPFTKACSHVIPICHKQPVHWKKYDANQAALCHIQKPLKEE